MSVMPSTRISDWRRTAITATLVAMSVTLGGCFSTAKPVVEVVDLELAERSEDGLVFEVEIAGVNRTKKDFQLREMRYWLFLDGKRVFEGRRSPQATFSALGIQSFTAPIAVAREDLPDDPVARYEFGAVITYLVPGALAEAFFELRVRKPRVHVVERGEIQLRPEEASVLDEAPS